MKQFPRDQTVTESDFSIYQPLHRNLPTTLFLISEEESQNASGIKAAGPGSTHGDMDKEQMRAATGGEIKEPSFNHTCVSQITTSWVIALGISADPPHCSRMLCARLHTHYPLSKARLIFEPSHPPSVFSHWFS